MQVDLLELQQRPRGLAIVDRDQPHLPGGGKPETRQVRLDARPIATLSLDAQERREHLQKQMGD